MPFDSVTFKTVKPITEADWYKPKPIEDELLRDLMLLHLCLAKGWCKNAYAKTRGRPHNVLGADQHCITGAIITVVPVGARQLRVIDTLNTVLGFPRQSVAAIDEIVDFNDHRNTTQADVLALIERAIAHREKELAL